MSRKIIFLFLILVIVSIVVGPGSFATQEETINFDSVDGDTDAFALKNVNKNSCGTTCQKVRADVTNTGEGSLSNVTVFATVYAGEGPVVGKTIWSNSETLGLLTLSETVTVTEEVRWGFNEVQMVRENNGWITIEIKIKSSSKRVVYRKSEKVL